VSRKHDYDRALEPPAPVLPLRVAAPEGDAAVLLAALVDTGADMTAVPARLARQLELPAVGAVAVRGADGRRSHCTIYAAAVEVEGRRHVLEVLALGTEALVGRDLLRHWIVTLDGPRSELRLRPAPTASPRAARSR
jgi:predicted aspartyl protease